jgi:hypothetical protein
MICEHCQNYVPEDSRFCRRCGVRLWIDPRADRPWRWIVALFLFAIVSSVVFRDELKVQLLEFRAEVNRALSAL